VLGGLEFRIINPKLQPSLTVMLGEFLGFTAEFVRALEPIFPELMIGLFSIRRSSLPGNQPDQGAAYRFSRMRPRRVFGSAGERLGAEEGGLSKSKSKEEGNLLGIFGFFDARLQRFFAPRLRFSRSRRR
jgi:hypothetical protein